MVFEYHPLDALMPETTHYQARHRVCLARHDVVLVGFEDAQKLAQLVLRE